MDHVHEFNMMFDLGKLGLIKTPYVPPDLKPDDIVMLLPTSGSSGNPKLTILTNSMLLHQVVVPRQGRLTVMYSFEPLRQSLDGRSCDHVFDSHVKSIVPTHLYIA